MGSLRLNANNQEDQEDKGKDMDVAKARKAFSELHCAYMGDDRKEIESKEKQWKAIKEEWKDMEEFLKSFVIDWYNNEVIGKA
jgi:hypothetical protein